MRLRLITMAQQSLGLLVSVLYNSDMEEMILEKNYIPDRITELRTARGISERKMSLDLGHSTSYIRSITTGRTLPSMTEFLYICEYLQVTPEEFFNESYAFSEDKQKIIRRVQSMSDAETVLMLKYMDFLDKLKSN